MKCPSKFQTFKMFSFSDDIVRAAEISMLVQCLEKWAEKVSVITSLN